MVVPGGAGLNANAGNAVDAAKRLAGMASARRRESTAEELLVIWLANASPFC